MRPSETAGSAPCKGRPYLRGKVCLEGSAGAGMGNGARRRAPFPIPVFTSLQCCNDVVAASARKSGEFPILSPQIMLPSLSTLEAIAYQ